MSATSVQDAVSRLVDRARHTPFVELEGSLGRWSKNRFVPGVDGAHFTHVLETLKRAAAGAPQRWDGSPTQASFATCLFPDGVRTRFDAKGQATTCHKKILQRVDVRVSNTPYALRLTLSSEVPSAAPERRLPDHVRLSQRVSLGYDRLFRYDLTRVASGKNRDAACYSPIRFEVELELAMGSKAALAQSNAHLAQSLVGKLVDLLGRFTPSGDRVRRECGLRSPSARGRPQ